MATFEESYTKIPVPTEKTNFCISESDCLAAAKVPKKKLAKVKNIISDWETSMMNIIREFISKP